MILDSSDLLEKIIKELKDLMSEATITKAMLTPRDEKKEPTNLIELLEYIKKEGKEMHEINCKMKFLEGKMEAYVKVLELMGCKIDLNEEQL